MCINRISFKWCTLNTNKRQSLTKRKRKNTRLLDIERKKHFEPTVTSISENREIKKSRLFDIVSKLSNDSHIFLTQTNWFWLWFWCCRSKYSENVESHFLPRRLNNAHTHSDTVSSFSMKEWPFTSKYILLFLLSVWNYSSLGKQMKRAKNRRNKTRIKNWNETQPNVYTTELPSATTKVFDTHMGNRNVENDKILLVKEMDLLWNRKDLNEIFLEVVSISSSFSAIEMEVYFYDAFDMFQFEGTINVRKCPWINFCQTVTSATFVFGVIFLFSAFFLKISIETISTIFHINHTDSHKINLNEQ